jgi:hypothetical protein
MPSRPESASDLPISIERLITTTREGTTFWFKDDFIFDAILPGGINAIFVIHHRDVCPRWQLFVIHSAHDGELFRTTRPPDEADPAIPTPVDQLFAAVLQTKTHKL